MNIKKQGDVYERLYYVLNKEIKKVAYSGFYMEEDLRKISKEFNLPYETIIRVGGIRPESDFMYSKDLKVGDYFKVIGGVSKNRVIDKEDREKIRKKYRIVRKVDSSKMFFPKIKGFILPGEKFSAKYLVDKALQHNLISVENKSSLSRRYNMVNEILKSEKHIEEVEEGIFKAKEKFFEWGN